MTKDAIIEPNHGASAVTALTALSKFPASLSVSDAASVAPQPQRPAKELLTLMEACDGRPPFEHVAALALHYFDDVVEDILGLEGELRGKQFVAYNPKRDDTSLGSFSINSETGVFKDFAVDDCGGSDLIALAAYVWECNQTDAAVHLLEALADLEAEHGHARHESIPLRVVPPALRTETSVSVEPIHDDAPDLQVEGFVYRGESLEARYDYTTEDGKLCFVVLRIRKPDGSKSFRPVGLMPEKGGTNAWMPKMPPGKRPLFGLTQLPQAAADARLFVTEGEKATLALRQMLPGSPVFTSANGSQAASKSDWEPLAGRNVAIWPDNDAAGLKYQQDVIKLIQAIEPTTPISVVNVEALLRAVCGLKGWAYDDKAAEFVGWDAADLAALGLEARVISAAIDQSIEWVSQEHPSSQSTKDVAASPIKGVTWNSGKDYRMTLDGVEVMKESATKSYWAKVCSKLEIVRQLRDAEGAGWSLELIVTAPDQTTKAIVLPKAWLMDPQRLKALLLDHGVLIYNWVELQDYLAHAIPTETHKLVRRVGWHDGAYVHAGATYGEAQEPLALDSTAPACNGFSQFGSPDTWNAEIGRLCAGNSRLMLAVCAALAGPLLRPLGIENGGFHLVGPSSVGKTTAC